MSKVNFYPAEQRVLVLMEEKENTKLKSGLFLPAENSTNKVLRGRVITSGKGSKDRPMVYFPGQTVIFSEYAGLDLTLDLGGTERVAFYKVMDQLDIIGVIKKITK